MYGMKTKACVTPMCSIGVGAPPAQLVATDGTDDGY